MKLFYFVNATNIFSRLLRRCQENTNTFYNCDVYFGKKEQLKLV